MPHIAYKCEIWHNPFVKPVVWMGGSREDVRRFPETAQDSLGFELYRVPCGFDPKDWKPIQVSVPARRKFVCEMKREFSE
jgi:phage-related protein